MEEYRDVHFSSDSLKSYLVIIGNSDMSKKQKEKINKFVSDLKLGKAGKKVKDRRISNYLQFLVRLHEYFKKDLDSITEKQAENFYKDLSENKILKKNNMPYAQASKDEYVKTLKRYLGWSWGKDSIKYRKGVRWMKEDYKKSNKRAINLKDAGKCISQEPSIRNKCLFMFLFDSGARIEEALNVRIKDLQISGNGDKFFKVHLRGQKTEEADRTIPIPLSKKYLSNWMKNHPTKEEGDYLFPIKYDNSRKIIKQMSNRALGFELKPHELRHSSATHYIQNGGFGAENIGGFYYRYGWKFGSEEALTYIKTFLYSGDLGSEKVVKAIESGKVEELEGELEELRRNSVSKQDVIRLVQQALMKTAGQIEVKV